MTSFDLGTNRTYIANNLNQYTQISNLCDSASLCEEFNPQFDDDGNQTLVQTATGIWQVQYNGENRPVLWENVSTNSPTFNSTTPSLISMSYDHMGRRRTKDGQRFFYDGYLQVANERTVSNAVVRQSFVWDPTEPVATRPLAWLCSNAPPRLYTHDGNKNVSEVVVAASGTNAAVEVVAHYDYAAFGAVIAQKGGCAETNPWRFSSEYEDTELGLDYYNYRHYEPETGRWLQRDPIDAFCLYVWCDNRPCNSSGVDVLGLTNEPGAFGWDNYSVEQRQCCNGTSYFPSSSCCRNGKILSACQYDIEAFKNCMNAKRNAPWKWTAWNNCGDFVEEAVFDCMRKASYDK